MRKFISAGMMLILSFSLVSCSAMMAVKKPDKKDLNVLAVGTPRDIVISEFGLPDKTEKLTGVEG